MSDNGLEPLGRVIAPNTSVRRRGPAQRPALSKSADLATPLSLLDGGRRPFQSRERAGGIDAPRARRPVGSVAATNARVRSRRTSHR